ncbi:PKD domain-containing protein [Fulvivirga maritima]|uniref:PKD-like domain-containing protein n=1 Tax=Fulvivirga maritima TaxID=2904247 RepID=UPI001F298623|nr:PKD-like domain-containing protein [Fulvivirga maritima]UII26446.1 PKD domain-containing protein [Fulvivirga maritima]
MKRRNFFGFNILLLFFLFIGSITAFGQSANCAQNANFGVLTSTSLNCGGDEVTRTVVASSSSWSNSDVIQVNVNWEDGTTETLNLTYIDVVGEWRVQMQHTYQDNGPTCSYEASAQLVINGAACTGADLNQDFLVIVYDELDNPNVGQQILNHDESSAGNEVGDEIHVCEGETSPIRARDESEFNCTQPELVDASTGTDARNREERWVQYVYGTSSSITGNVTIGGQEVTSLPYYGPVVFIGDNTPDPSNELTLDIQLPETAESGETFIVELRSWNVCNPYDNNTSDGYLNPVGGSFNPTVDSHFGSFPNGSDAPVTITKTIRVVDKPLPLIPVDKVICEGETVPNFEVTVPQPSMYINWFDDDPRTGGNYITNYWNNSNTLPPNLYPGGINTHSPGVYSVWVTYNAAAGLQCESDPVEVTIEIKEDLDQPGIISPDDPVCRDDQDVVFSVPDPPGTGVKYVWSVSGTGISIDGSNEGNSVTVDFNVPGTFTSTTREISVVRQYITDPACESDPRTLEIPISGGPTASVSGGGAVCAGLPADDIVFTFSSDFPADFDFIIEIYENGSSTPTSYITESNYTSTTYIIPDPAPSVETEYRLVMLSDAAGCDETLNISNTITIGGTPPTVDEVRLIGGPVCDDGAGTSTAYIEIEVADNSVKNYEIQYRIDGGSIIRVTLSSNASGVVRLVPDFINELGGITGSYVYEILSIKEASSGCITDVNESETIVINPRPDEATGGEDVIACQTDIFSTSIQVDAPGTGLTIDWYAGDNPSTSILLSGNNVFTPGSAGTYYAEVRDITTGCVSEDRVPVTLIMDVLPSTADAGTAPAPFCETFYDLSATVPTSGTGVWTYPGMLYSQGFAGEPNGATSGNGTFGWSTQADQSQLVDADDYFEVRNGRLEARDTDEEAVWTSSPIDISGVSEMDFEIALAQSGAMEATGSGRDYVGVYYQIDGGAEVLIGGEQSGNFGSVNISETIPGGGSSLVIVVRLRTNADDEIISFDDIKLISNDNTVVIDGAYDPAATVSGLPVGTTTLTWTVSSEYGVCAPSVATIDLERLPPPSVTDPEPEVCEGVSGSGTAEVDLTAYIDDIVGASVSSERQVDFYEDDALTAAIGDPTAYEVSDGQVLYVNVENTVTGCTNDDTMTFAVVGLPAANDFTAELCEDVLDDGIVDGVDLTAYEEDIISPADPSDRVVSWFTDASIDPVYAVSNPSSVDGIQDGDTFYALVDNSAAGCSDIAELSIIVHPQPRENPIQVSGSTPAAITLCVNDTEPVFFQVSGSLNPNSTYQWTLPGSGEFVVESGTTLDNFFLPLTFPTAVPAPGLPISIVETTANGCEGEPNVIMVTVVDIPDKPVILGDDEVCEEDENITYSISSPNVGSQYIWNVPGAFGSIVSGQNTNEIIVNIGSQPGNYQITVQEISSNACESPEADPFDVTVYEQPTMTSGNSAGLCSGMSVDSELVFTSDLPTATFEWQVISKSGPVGGTAVGNTGTGNITDVLTNGSTSVGQVTYEVTPVGPTPGICPGPSQFIFVSVEPEPALNVAGAGAVCNGDNISLQITTPTSPTDASDLSYDYRTESSDDANTGGTAYISATDRPYNTTLNGTLINNSDEDITVTFFFTPKFDGCTSGDEVEKTVIVEPSPKITMVNNNPRICNGDAIDIDISSPTEPSVPGDLFFNYNTISSDLSVTGGSAFVGSSAGRNFPATLNGTLTNSGDHYITVDFEAQAHLDGCGQSTVSTESVIVEPTPKAVLNNHAQNICSGEDIDIEVTSPTTVSPGSVLTYNYSAVSSNGAVTHGDAMVGGSDLSFGTTLDGDIVNNGNSSITVTFTITPYVNGCATGTSVTTAVVVEPAPVALLNNNSETICSGGSVNINVSSTTNINDPSKLSYSYVVNAPTGISGTGLTGGSGNFPGNISGTLTNSTDAALDVTYVVTPHVDGCPSGFDVTETVTVEPVPAANPQETTLIVCNDEYFEVDVLSPTQPTEINDLTYSYVVTSNNEAFTSGSGNIDRNGLIFGVDKIEGELHNSSDNVITVTYTITPMLSGCAAGPPRYVTIQVEPSPRLTLTNNRPAICDGGQMSISVALQSTGTDDTKYSYSYTASSSNLGVSGAGMTSGSGAFPASDITGDLVNTSDEAATVVYEFTPLYAGCEDGDPQYVNVIVEPTPSVEFDNNAPDICSGGAVDIDVYSNTLPTDGNGLTFNYTVSADGPIEGSASSGASGRSQPFNINGTLTNPGNAPVTVTYLITPQLSGCSNGTAVPVQVVVEPVPRAEIENRNPVLCNDDEVEIEVNTPITSSEDLTFDVATSSSPAGAISGAGYTFSGTDLPFGTVIGGELHNNSNEVVTVTYTITPKLDGCTSGNAQTTTVVVDPTPQVVVVNNGSSWVCSGGNVNIGISSPTTPNIPGNFTLSYTVSSTNDAAMSGSAWTNAGGRGFPYSIGGSLINNSNEVVTVTYDITATLAGCDIATDQISIDVQPDPVLNPVLNATPIICTSDEISLTLSTPTLTRTLGDLSFDYTVISSDPSVTGGSAWNNGVGRTNLGINPNNDYELDGRLTNSSSSYITVTYTFTPRVNGCTAGDPVEARVQVEPTPQLSYNMVHPLPGDPICTGEFIDFEVFNEISPANRASMTFDLVVSNSNGPSAISGSAYTDQTDLPYPSRIYGDLINNTNVPTTIYFDLYPKLHGCVGPRTRIEVNIEGRPIANSFTIDECSDVPVNQLKTVDLTEYNDQVSAGSGFTISWYRDVFMNSAVPDETSYTAIDGIQLYARVENDVTGCYNVGTITFQINPQPEVAATVTYYDGVYGVSCLGASDGEIQASSANVVGTPTFELLDENQISLGVYNQDGHFEGLPAGQYYIAVYNQNTSDCRGVTLAPAILPAPFELTGGFVYAQPGGICAGESPAIFTEMSAPYGGTTGGNGYLYQWQYSDDGVTYSNISGATSATYQHGVISDPGTYYFLRQVSTPNGCGPVYSNGGVPIEVVVNTIPGGDIAFSDGPGNPDITSICEGSPFLVNFNFFNGVNQNLFEAPYTFVYQDPEGTSHTQLATNTATVYINEADPLLHEGDWTLLTVTDRNGCTSSPNAVATIDVVEINADFTILESSPQCGPATYTFEFDQLSGVTYTFDWQDGTPDEVIAATTDEAGRTVTHLFQNGSTSSSFTYNVTLTAEGPQCSNYTQQAVVVDPGVIATVLPRNPIVCSGEVIEFTNSSRGATAQTWKLIDPDTGSELLTSTDVVPSNWSVINSTGPNPKTYTVDYTGENTNTGCSTTSSFSVQVYKEVVADFDYDVDGIFMAGSIGVDFWALDPIDASEFSYSWNFGNGETRDDADPTAIEEVTYYQPANKTVRLRVENEASSGICFDEALKVIPIGIEPVVPDFDISTTMTCTGSELIITNNTTGGANHFEWSIFDDDNHEVYSRSDEVTPGQVDPSADFTLKISEAGVYNVRLIATNTYNNESETIVKSGLLEIFAAPNANFDYRPDEVFVPDQPVITFNYTEGANQYYWDFGDGSISQEFEPQHNYQYEGEFDITLTAYADYGNGTICEDQITRSITATDGGYTRVPNAFTPNTSGPSGDGRIISEVDNDIFLPITRGVEEFEMLIFDRWGNLIFESQDQTVGWDGYDVNDQLMPAGVYVFKLTLRLSNGERTTRIGDVTLIR